MAKPREYIGKESFTMEPLAQEGVKVVRTTVWTAPGCHNGCGMRLYVKGDRLIKVEADPDHPHNQGKACCRCLALTQVMYHPQRILYPMKRVGERGENKWERITWDDALNTIEAKFKEIIADPSLGPESIVVTQGTGRDIGGWITMLAYSLGTPNWTYLLNGTSCYTPFLASMFVAYGDFAFADFAQFFEKRYDDPRFKVPKYMMLWGSRPTHVNSLAIFGHWVCDLMKKGTKLITIDPMYTWEASKSDLWLQIRPGTDPALAIGFLKVVVEEGLYDKEWVEKWTTAPFLIKAQERKLLREADLIQGGSQDKFVSWDQNSNGPAIYNPDKLDYEVPSVKPMISGSHVVKLADGNEVECITEWDVLVSRLQEYSLDRIQEITWIPKEKIRKAATLFASEKPSSILTGVPLDMTPAAVPGYQAIQMLYCITGELDAPGGMPITRYACGVETYPRYAKYATYEKMIAVDKKPKRIGTWKYPLVRDFRTWAQPDMVIDQMLTGKPYPIKALWIQTSNFVNCTTADSRRALAAGRNVPFVVAVDLFLNPTIVALADIVLPTTTWAEKDSIKPWWVPLNAMKKVIPPVGESKPDPEINYEIGKRFRPELWPGETFHDVLDALLKPAGVTFKELSDRVYLYSPDDHPSTPYHRYARGLLRPDGRPGFNTRSGKYEIWPTLFEEWGYDPLPYYEEPPYTHDSNPTLKNEYPLILMTGNRIISMFHSEYRQIPWMREINPDPTLHIHPKTAEQYGISNGDWVWVENQFGRCKRRAEYTLAIHQKMVHAQHGWWLPEKPAAEPSLFGQWEYGLNVLVPSTGRAESTSIYGFGGFPGKSLICKLYKVKEGE